MVYMAKDKNHKLEVLRCIKTMMYEKIAEKNLFKAIKQEIKILSKVSRIDGCIRLLEIEHSQDSL